MMPRIAAVRSALPGNSCRQAEFADAFATRGSLSPAERVLLGRLHAAAQVDTRHTVLPIAECGQLAGVEAVNDRYITEAAALAEQALRGALEAAGLSPADLDLLIMTSVTGVSVPSLDARLSVLHILELVSETERPPPGFYGLMIGLGPGVSAELVLLRW